MRRLPLAVLALSLAACTGTTGPALYPDVAGTYDVTGTMSNGNGVGPLVAIVTITQPSREAGDVGGGLSLLTNKGTYSAPMAMSGQVDHKGVVSACADYNPPIVWCFSGQLAPDGTLRGTHTLGDSVTTYASGEWTGRRR